MLYHTSHEPGRAASHDNGTTETRSIIHLMYLLAF